MKQGPGSRLLVAGLMIAALALVLFFMVGKPLVTAYTRMRLAASRRKVFGLPEGPEPEHMRGAPLPSGQGAPGDMDFRVKYVAWLNRVITEHYPANDDPKGAAYIRGTVDYIGGDYQTPTYQSLVATERAFDLKTVTDPGLALMIGIIEPNGQRQRDALDKAVAGMPASRYPKFVWFLAAANAGRAAALANADSDEVAKRDALSLKYLAAGLDDGSIQPGDMEALRWRFDSSSMQDLFFRNAAAMANVFDASHDVAPWVKEYVEGVRYTEAAWAARGNGTSQNVTQQGWTGFTDNLASARTHLVASWTDHPGDPAAATEMIKVCMGENEEKETMRKWFDRAVMADFDFAAAYKNFEWGLRPRWMGSYMEMNAFGEECAATGRYDTWVPYQRAQVALDISEDASDRGEQFRDQRVASEVLNVVDRYLAEPKPPIKVAYNQTFAAIVAYKAGRYDEEKQHLTAIHFRPTRVPLFTQMVDLQALVTEAQGK